MSALGDLLGWLWAAVWLRWRLAGVKARGLVARRTAVAGADARYALAPADVPVEGVDYDPGELPAGLQARLQDTRAELLGYARSSAAMRRRRRGARRRRVGSSVAVAVVALSVVGAGATALVTGSTGVPEVDRWLGIHDAKLDKPREPDQFGPWGRDLQPTPSGAGPTIEVRREDGSLRMISASYVARSGDICSTVTDTNGDDQTGNVSCVGRAFLSNRLRRENGLVSGGVSTRETRVLFGFVTAKVARMSVRGPTKPLDVRIGSTWAPDVPSVGRLKPFVVIEPARPAVVNPGDYEVYVQIGKGRPTEIRP